MTRFARILAVMMLVAAMATTGHAQSGAMSPDQMKMMSDPMKMMGEHMQMMREPMKGKK
jgi:hypothetical protein